MQQINDPATDPRAVPNPRSERLSSAPAPAGEELRDAYLSLLAAAICDLAGAGTLTVERRPGGDLFSRELMDDETDRRLEGSDWPLNSLSMGGLGRLAVLRSCVERVAADGVPGDVIDVGAWRGGGALLMRATLDTLEGVSRSVWAADSFAGYPVAQPDDGAGSGLAGLDYMVVRRSEVEGTFERFGLREGVRFLPGFFEETLPGLREESWAMISVDTRVGFSTALALDALYPALSPGGWVVVDGWDEPGVRAAVEQCRAQAGAAGALDQTSDRTVRWRKGEAETPADPPSPNGAGVHAAPRVAHARVPTARELELQAEVQALRERLALASEVVARLEGKR